MGESALSNVDIAIMSVSFFVVPIVVAFGFGLFYDWWYARKKQRRAKGG